MHIHTRICIHIYINLFYYNGMKKIFIKHIITCSLRIYTCVCVTLCTVFNNICWFNLYSNMYIFMYKNILDCRGKKYILKNE